MFFCRFDGLDLTPGEKRAGFDLVVQTKALQVLRSVPLSDKARSFLRDDAQRRIRHAQLLKNVLVDSAQMEFVEDSWCPRWFCVGREFGSSMGADSQELCDLTCADRFDRLDEELRYTPHNVDAPQVALALMLLAQAWAEQAFFVLESPEQYRKGS